MELLWSGRIIYKPDHNLFSTRWFEQVWEPGSTDGKGLGILYLSMCFLYYKNVIPLSDI